MSDVNVYIRDDHNSPQEYTVTGGVGLRKSDGTIAKFYNVSGTGDITTKDQLIDAKSLEYVRIDPFEQAKIIGANIKSGISILGQAGSYSGDSTPYIIGADDQNYYSSGTNTITPQPLADEIVITQPTNLLASNIVDNVPIAGVVGSLGESLDLDSLPADIFVNSTAYSYTGGIEAPAFVSGKYYAYDGSEYIALLQQPLDWNQQYANYYEYRNHQYVPVIGAIAYGKVTGTGLFIEPMQQLGFSVSDKLYVNTKCNDVVLQDIFDLPGELSWYYDNEQSTKIPVLKLTQGTDVIEFYLKFTITYDGSTYSISNNTISLVMDKSIDGVDETNIPITYYVKQADGSISAEYSILAISLPSSFIVNTYEYTFPNHTVSGSSTITWYWLNIFPQLRAYNFLSTRPILYDFCNIVPNYIITNGDRISALLFNTDFVVPIEFFTNLTYDLPFESLPNSSCLLAFGCLFAIRLPDPNSPGDYVYGLGWMSQNQQVTLYASDVYTSLGITHAGWQLSTLDISADNIVADYSTMNIIFARIFNYFMWKESWEFSISQTPAYIIKNNDSLTNLYFNTTFTIPSDFFYALDYDLPFGGQDDLSCHLGFNHLYAIRLPTTQTPSSPTDYVYGLGWESSSQTVLYASDAYPALGITTAGWQLASLDVSSDNIEVSFGNLNPQFARIINYIMSKEQVQLSFGASI